MTCQKTVPAQGDTLFAAELRYNSGLVRPGSVPLYAGNISEWQWQNADGRTHTYSFSYDASGRLTGSALFSEGNADGSFTEGGIIYDRNGNIIGLTRTNGEDEFAKGFAYQGNMLKSLCGKDEISGEYLYDGSGNMTHDGHNGLDLEYNRINLMQKVTRNGAAIADYRYLYNGTKLNAMDSRGEGLEYHGPLTYRMCKDGSVSLSEARFAGGRFVRMRGAEGDTMEPVYTFTDHLGSVRAQASSGGNLMEHDNYLPFGTRWDDGSPTDPDNRYRFNGKEEQSFAGLPYIDYGARMYDPCTARWLSQDPLAEKYCSVSPYAFCNNNPVNIIDPNGMDIWTINKYGYISWVEESEEHRLYATDKDGELTEDYITVKDRRFLDELSKAQSNKEVSKTSTDDTVDDIFNIFKFAADNTSVEWVIHKNGNSYTLGTIHDSDNAGGWEDYGLEKPDASVHSHPGINTSLGDELYSMGSDYDNVVLDVKKNGRQTRMNYVYFPATTRLYHVGRYGVQYIRDINNNYKRFYFGTLNNR